MRAVGVDEPSPMASGGDLDGGGCVVHAAARWIFLGASPNKLVLCRPLDPDLEGSHCARATGVFAFPPLFSHRGDGVEDCWSAAIPFPFFLRSVGYSLGRKNKLGHGPPWTARYHLQT
jgi:hypothetical protein